MVPKENPPRVRNSSLPPPERVSDWHGSLLRRQDKQVLRRLRRLRIMSARQQKRLIKAENRRSPVEVA